MFISYLKNQFFACRLACLSVDLMLFLSSVRILILFSCFFLASLLGTFAETSNALAVQRILERYTESLGGSRMVEALSSLSI